MKKLLQAIGRIFNLVVLSKEEYQKIIDGPPKVDGEPIKPTTLLKYSEVVNMLESYDETRPKMQNKYLRFEDSRVNTFNFKEVKNYLAYADKLADEKGIKLTGISFVKGVYSQDTTKNKMHMNYENLMYLPKAMVNGEEVSIDLLNSTKEKTVTFKEMLERYGYNWRYDNAKDFKLKQEENQELKMARMSAAISDSESFVANFSHISPPY